VLYDPALDDHVAETQQMNDLVAAFMAATPMELTPETIANLRGHNALAAQEPLDFAEVRTIDGPHGPIDLRILRPDSVDGVYLEIHGGGWAIGAADHSDAANWNLAQAASGTLFGAMTVRTAARDLMLAVVLFPLIAPTLLAAVAGTRELLGGASIAELGDYFRLMLVFDAVFTAGGLALFGTLVEG
jgi:hypothetical protein